MATGILCAFFNMKNIGGIKMGACYKLENGNTQLIYNKSFICLDLNTKYSKLTDGYKKIYEFLYKYTEDMKWKNGANDELIAIQLSMETISIITNKSKDTVNKAIKALEEVGLISIIRDGRGTCNKIIVYSPEVGDSDEVLAARWEKAHQRTQEVKIKKQKAKEEKKKLSTEQIDEEGKPDYFNKKSSTKNRLNINHNNFNYDLIDKNNIAPDLGQVKSKIFIQQRDKWQLYIEKLGLVEFTSIVEMAYNKTIFYISAKNISKQEVFMKYLIKTIISEIAAKEKTTPKPSNTNNVKPFKKPQTRDNYTQNLKYAPTKKTNRFHNFKGRTENYDAASLEAAINKNKPVHDPDYKPEFVKI